MEFDVKSYLSYIGKTLLEKITSINFSVGLVSVGLLVFKGI